jgi:hypothetical protein
MMTAMARLYYTEMHLTAVVTASLLALALSRALHSRRWTLAWGALAGLGLLVKWTYPMYLALPLLWVSWQSGALQAALKKAPPQRHRGAEQHKAWLGVDWRRLVLAVVVGCGAALLWFWPNRTLAAELPAGVWVLPMWAILWSATVYALLSAASRGRPAPLHNLWAALLLGASIASLWYLPRLDFIQQRGKSTEPEQLHSLYWLLFQ